VNILYDLTAAQPSKTAKFSGGAYYCEALFFALIKRHKNIIGVYNSNSYINPKILESGITIYDLNKVHPKNILEKEEVETFYTAWYKNNEDWQFTNIRYIATIHGARELEMPSNIISLYYANNFKRKLGLLKRFITKNIQYKKEKNKYPNAKIKYVTVSEHSKASIKSFYPHLNEKEIPVFYPPFIEDEEMSPLPMSLKIPQLKYFLLTSSARWEKNNMRAAWAFDELFTHMKDLDFKVILTGVTNENIFSRYLKNKEKFIFLNFIERSALLYLHKNAYAFIYPSLNEGFGYPPIESMRYGVPVAASGTSSIPEICQNAAIYFDPYNVSEIKNRIIQLLDKNIYNEYSARTVERYKAVNEKQKNDLESLINFILDKES